MTDTHPAVAKWLSIVSGSQVAADACLSLEVFEDALDAIATARQLVIPGIDSMGQEEAILCFLQELATENDKVNKSVSVEGLKNEDPQTLMNVIGFILLFTIDDDNFAHRLEELDDSEVATLEQMASVFKSIRETIPQTPRQSVKKAQATPGSRRGLQKFIDSATLENGELIEELEDLKRELMRKDAEIMGLRFEAEGIHALKEQVAELEAESTAHHALEQENERLQKEVAGLKDDLQVSREIQQQLEADAANTETHMARVEELREELSSKEQTNQELVSQMRQLTDTIQEMRQECEIWKEKAGEAQEEMHALRQHLQEAEENSARAKAESTTGDGKDQDIPTDWELRFTETYAKINAKNATIRDLHAQLARKDDEIKGAQEEALSARQAQATASRTEDIKRLSVQLAETRKENAALRRKLDDIAKDRNAELTARAEMAEQSARHFKETRDQEIANKQRIIDELQVSCNRLLVTLSTYTGKALPADMNVSTTSSSIMTPSMRNSSSTQRARKGSFQSQRVTTANNRVTGVEHESGPKTPGDPHKENTSSDGSNGNSTRSSFSFPTSSRFAQRSASSPAPLARTSSILGDNKASSNGVSSPADNEKASSTGKAYSQTFRNIKHNSVRSYYECTDRSRFDELRNRNARQRPHLRSSHPLETNNFANTTPEKRSVDTTKTTDSIVQQCSEAPSESTVAGDAVFTSKAHEDVSSKIVQSTLSAPFASHGSQPTSGNSRYGTSAAPPGGKIRRTRYLGGKPSFMMN